EGLAEAGRLRALGEQIVAVPADGLLGGALKPGGVDVERVDLPALAAAGPEDRRRDILVGRLRTGARRDRHRVALDVGTRRKDHVARQRQTIADLLVQLHHYRVAPLLRNHVAILGLAAGRICLAIDDARAGI